MSGPRGGGVPGPGGGGVPGPGGGGMPGPGGSASVPCGIPYTPPPGPGPPCWHSEPNKRYSLCESLQGRATTRQR